MNITLGTLAPEGTSYHRMLLEMREKWRKAPGGVVGLQILRDSAIRVVEITAGDRDEFYK